MTYFENVTLQGREREREKREGTCALVKPCFQRRTAEPENSKALRLSIGDTARFSSEGTCDMKHHTSVVQLTHFLCAMLGQSCCGMFAAEKHHANQRGMLLGMLLPCNLCSKSRSSSVAALRHARHSSSAL